VLGDGVPGHQDDPCGDECEHDPELARELVAELKSEGITPGDVQLDFDEDVTQEAVAKSIQANLQAVGISATLRPKPLKEHQDFSVSGQQELFRLGWIAAYPSPDAFVTPLFLTGSRSNLTGFTSPEVDALLRAARANPDADQRVDQYRQAERLIMAQVPIVPIAQFQVQAVRSERVHGLVPTSFGTFDASRVWLTGAG
jgi:ABC-type oligopeptide transport system substrate-binding subunit